MINRILLFIIAAVTFTSCDTTSFITLEVLRPAKVNFASPVSKIVVVDHSVAQPNKVGHYVYLFQKKEGTQSFNADSLKQQFVSALTQKVRIEKGIPVATRQVLSEKQYTDSQPLDMMMVKEIVDSTNANVIISIDNVAIQSLYRLIFLKNENLYRLTFDASHSCVLNIFEKNGDDSFATQTLVHRDSLFWENYNFFADEVVARFPNTKLCIGDLVNHSVDQLYKKLFPTKEIVQRTLYGTTAANMQDAARYVHQNKWQEASYIWEYEYERSKNTRLKGFCAANLALYCEICDKFDDAIEWAETAKTNFRLNTKSKINGDDQRMGDYASDLRQRKAEALMLDKQKN